MAYRVTYTDKAVEHLTQLQKSEPKAFAKAQQLIEELKVHPRTGTGHPEQLKGYPEGRWSRRISQKHRLVYRIYEEDIVVLVLAAMGHYGDR